MENRENASKSVWKATPNSFITLLFCVYNVFPDFLLCVLKKLSCLHFVSSLYSNSSTTTILEWVMLLAGISASAGSVLQSFNIIFHSIFQFSPFTNFTPHFTSTHSFLIFLFYFIWLYSGSKLCICACMSVCGGANTVWQFCVWHCFWCASYNIRSTLNEHFIKPDGVEGANDKENELYGGRQELPDSLNCHRQLYVCLH